MGEDTTPWPVCGQTEDPLLWGVTQAHTRIDKLKSQGILSDLIGISCHEGVTEGGLWGH